MIITDLITRERIVCDSEVTSKKRVIEVLSERLATGQADLMARPLLNERLDQWAADDLPRLRRVMLELERDRLVAELNAEFDRDRESGRLARLPEIIREARAALALRPPRPA